MQSIFYNYSLGTHQPLYYTHELIWIEQNRLWIGFLEDISRQREELSPFGMSRNG